jgi:hypothetical protein
VNDGCSVWPISRMRFFFGVLYIDCMRVVDFCPSYTLRIRMHVPPTRSVPPSNGRHVYGLRTLVIVKHKLKNILICWITVLRTEEHNHITKRR